MNRQLIIFTIFGILITSVGTTTVFGENESVIVSTDKSSYSANDVILISGEIKYIALGNQLSLIIQSPNGNIAYIGQMTVNSDNQFSTEINPGGSYWKIPGTYTIQITQNENNQANTSFEFKGITNVPENKLEQNIMEDIVTDDPVIIDSIVTATTLTIQESTDLISYEITNGKITNVIPDLDAVSLLIDIEAINDGSITLTIPRLVLDATINDKDDEFFVLVDGEEVDFEEISTLTDRTLTIEFLAGSEQIEIIGTFVIPEFGTIAAMILAVAIISIIAISAKSRLSIVPRY
ncbi:MAG: PEFG-CTERM sorting domain-containing protein [Nitrosopumilus sp.]|nr:PEFG-CTERM sorting domain-containing protein [Nitrosopumilus sp.]